MKLRKNFKKKGIRTMIHSETPLILLNCDGFPGEKRLDITPAELFQKYAEYVKYIDRVGEISDKRIIDFVDNKIDLKINDQLGWTQIICVLEVPYVGEWVDVYIPNGQRVVLSEDQIVPVFSAIENRIGFHGEVQYKYILKNAKDLNKNNRICYIANNRRFYPVTPTKYPDASGKGYIIITKSNFFSANHFTLYSSMVMPSDTKKEMYK